MDAILVDENQPLLCVDEVQRLAATEAADPALDFDPKGDPDNPLEWPAAFKWSMVLLLAFTAFTVTFTCISVVPVASRIAYELDGGHGSKSASVLLVTIWELGEAAGPLLIAPLSEVFGRYPVMNAANCLFIIATVLAAVSQSMSLFIAARALTGFAVASTVLNPAIVGDMFMSEQRGSPMSLIMLAPLIGGAVGPAISGAISQSVGWRKVIWMSVLLASVCEVLFFTCSRETYRVPILRRKAAKLRAATGHDVAKQLVDTVEHRSLSKLWESVQCPALVISGSGVLLALSLFGAVSFTFYYIMAMSLPDVLEGRYGLSPAAAGSAFMSFSFGSFISVILCNLYLDKIYIKLRDSNNGVGQPEYRLPIAIVGAVTLPLAVSLFGWAAQLRLPLVLLLSSVGLLGFTLIGAFIPIMAYVVDAFGLYSASAMTGLIVTRCLMGTFLPLSTGPVVDSLGYGWGFTLFSVGSLCLVPIPVLLFRYGKYLRQHSSYTRDA